MQKKCFQNHLIAIPSTLTLLLTNQMGLAGKYLDYQDEFCLTGSSAGLLFVCFLFLSFFFLFLQVQYYFEKYLAL